jgi:UDP-N-acetylmuramyl pentapeptide phosphotransferase/UDP-N-acetylglucosamine-1-phosphate transferase
MISSLQFVLGFLLAAAITFGSSAIQHRRGADRRDRSSLNGLPSTTSSLAAIGAFIVAILLFGRTSASSGDVRWELTLVAAMFAIGLAGSITELSRQLRFGLQFAAIAAFVLLGPEFKFLPWPAANLALITVWLFVIANAFVLLDELGGLVAGTGLIASVAIAAIALNREHYLTAIAGFSMAGALTGFVVRGHSRLATRFGDSGALAIGVLMGLLSIHAGRGPHATWASRAAIPMLLMMVPLVDAATVTMTRLSVGAAGHIDNAYHRLGRLGLSRDESLLAMLIVQALASACAVMLSFVPEHEAVLMLPFVAITFALPVAFLMAPAFDARPRESNATKADFGAVFFSGGAVRPSAAAILDLSLASAAYFGALLIRFDFVVPEGLVLRMMTALPGVLIATLLAFALVGVHRVPAASSAVSEAIRFAAASALAAIIAGAASMLTAFVIPRGSCIVFAVLLFNMMVAARWSFDVLMRLARSLTSAAQRVLIVGADARGEAAVQHLFSHAPAGTELLGLVDDDDFKRGKLFHGYPVLGSIDELGEIFARVRFDEILIAQERLAPARMAELQNFAMLHKVSLRQFSFSLIEVDDVAVAPAAAAPQIRPHNA